MPTALPTLAELATLAHHHGRIAVATTTHGDAVLPATTGEVPLLGMRFGPAVRSVAVPLGGPTSPTLVIALDRFDDAIVLDPATGPTPIDPTTTTVLDPLRRALGLTTRPCRRPVWALVDLVWLDQVLAAVLDAPLGEPPGWPALSRLHPLHIGGPPPSPEGLAHRSRRYGVEWDAVRSGVMQHTHAWAPVSPSLAAWLDSGSFARHCFATLPDRDVILADLHELLPPVDARRIEAGLARP